MPSLLLVSLGPIQDFIASARRCQDLWFGSWLLSDLARVSASAISREGVSLIFPASDTAELDGKPSVANKILALVPDGASPRDVAERGKVAMKACLREHASAAFARIGDAKDHVHLDVAMQQIEDLMEYVWVSVPLAADRGDYKAQRDRAELLLAARKSTRTWTAVPWRQDGGVPKSSLDGLRESVLDERLFTEEGRRYRARLGVKDGERLCGIGLLKRLGLETDALRQRGPGFHSTSHIASAGWRAALTIAGGAPRSDTYVAFLDGLGVDYQGPRGPSSSRRIGLFPAPSALARNADGSILYEGRLDERVERSRLAAGKNREELTAALQRVREMRQRLIESCGVGEPTPYYALLLADGDNMGRAIDLESTFEGHQKLGKALDRFSTKCKAIVEEHAGSLVYAGGDDVLALLPLHTALECARALASEFEQDLRPFGAADARPTLSVGLAVAHHVVDFAEVREQAKRAEKLAKMHPGKNALGIIVEPRNGSSLEAVGSWNGDGETPLDQRIFEWCKLFSEEALPDKVAFALAESVEPLVPRKNELISNEVRELVSTAALSVILNALTRRRAGRGTTEVAPKVHALVNHHIAQGSKDALVAVRTLSQELQIARYFLEARELACRKPRVGRDVSETTEVSL